MFNLDWNSSFAVSQLLKLCISYWDCDYILISLHTLNKNNKNHTAVKTIF